MKEIGIFTVTSALHDEAAVQAATQKFLDSLNLDYDLLGSDFASYGERSLNLVYVRTGGTEGVFRKVLNALKSEGRDCTSFYLLTSGESNSLAASMEILSFLRQNGLKGEILHGDATYIHERVTLLAKVEKARKSLVGKRLGIIGQPSDWLISSKVCPAEVKEKLGIELIEIDINEVTEALTHANVSAEQQHAFESMTDVACVKNAVHGALALYEALKTVVANHQLSGFTIRCFDLLGVVHNTSCLALAKLNAEGIVAGCEGDVPALLSMTIAQAVTGVSGFQANPSRINPLTGEMLFAHCTIPLNMVQRYQLDTHFESGIGIGICGYMAESHITVFKVSGDLCRFFVTEGTLKRNQCEPNLCRTQQVITLCDASKARYFLTDPIGNHHIIVPGHVEAVLTALLTSL